MSFDYKMELAKHFFSSKRAEFYSDLAEALEDKAVLVDVIRTYERRAASRQDVIQPLYSLWLRRMDDRSFAQSLIGTVPDGDIMILDASEQSNRLIEGMKFLSQAIVASEKMKSELKMAIAGPIFLSIMLISMFISFSFYMVPVLTQIMKPETWPMSGRALYWVAQIITGFGAWIGAGLVLLSVTYVWSLPRWVGKWRSLFDRHIPLYSIYRDFVGSIFLVSLASLMLAKGGLSESLSAIAKRGSPWLRWHIRLIQLRLDKEAENQGKAFDTGIFNQNLTDRVIDYGARQSFHDAIGKVGLSSIGKTTSFVSQSAMVLNRTLLFFCGATLIFMVSGVLLTAQEAQNAIQSQTFKTR